MNKRQEELALGPYRVLDLSDEKGLLCGKILGDLGADVIKIEQPGGDPARRIGPFYNDTPDPEKSLYWFAYNTNKRGITLDIATSEGKKLFKRMVEKTDFLIESFPVGYMDELGIGYSALSKINPGIIMISISHFGQTGPYKNYKGCDIVDMAMSGYMYVCGDRDRPPVTISVPQAYLLAAADAAAGATMALYHRSLTGEGQCVDVSIQEAMTVLPYDSRIFWELIEDITHREGQFLVRRVGDDIRQERQTWACKEGHVSFITGAAIFTGRMSALMEWMTEEGMADDFLKDVDWKNCDFSLIDSEFIRQVDDCIAKFFKTHTSSELYKRAVEKKIMLYPVTTPKDIAENQQLSVRNFWEPVTHPELGTTITYPGEFLKATEMPLNIRKRAPLIGEHNEEVFGELGLTKEKLLALKQDNII